MTGAEGPHGGHLREGRTGRRASGFRSGAGLQTGGQAWLKIHANEETSLVAAKERLADAFVIGPDAVDVPKLLGERV